MSMEIDNGVDDVQLKSDPSATELRWKSREHTYRGIFSDMGVHCGCFIFNGPNNGIYHVAAETMAEEFVVTKELRR